MCVPPRQVIRRRLDHVAEAVRLASHSAAPKRANVLADEVATSGSGCLPSRFSLGQRRSQARRPAQQQAGEIASRNPLPGILERRPPASCRRVSRPAGIGRPISFGTSSTSCDRRVPRRTRCWHRLECQVPRDAAFSKPVIACASVRAITVKSGLRLAVTAARILAMTPRGRTSSCRRDGRASWESPGPRHGSPPCPRARVPCTVRITFSSLP